MTTPTTDPLTTILVSGAPFLAVDVKPDLDAGTFLVDVSEVGGDDLLGWSGDAAGVWVNVVCDVLQVATERGALQQQGPLSQTEAGQASFMVSDTQRRFDPLSNADAVHKGTPVRLRAWGYRDNGAGARWDAVLFTGKLDTPSVQYQRTGPPVVTITALDAVGPLVAWESEGRAAPGVGAGDNLLQRVQRVCTEVGVLTAPQVSAESDQLYEATLAPTVLDKPWGVINSAVRAELGRVWVDVDNQLVVRSRDSELSGPVRGTLSDLHGEAPLGVHCCIQGGLPVLSPQKVANRVLASRRVPQDPLVSPTPEPVPARVDDLYSQARYGVATLTDTALDVATDAQAAQWAQDVAMASAEPKLMVEQVQPAPWGNPYLSPADPNVWEAVCSTDIGDRWLYRLHPAIGPTVTRALGIVGVRHTITPDGWAIEWSTVDAPEPGAINPSGYFTVALSEVGGPDVLSLFGGQPPGSLFGDVDGGGAVQGVVTDTLDGGTATTAQYERTVDGGGARP